MVPAVPVPVPAPAVLAAPLEVSAVPTALSATLLSAVGPEGRRTRFFFAESVSNTWQNKTTQG